MALRGPVLANLLLILFAAGMARLSRPLLPEALWPILDAGLAAAVVLGVLSVLGVVVSLRVAAMVWFLLAIAIWGAVVLGPAGRTAVDIAALAHWPVVLMLLAAGLIGTRPEEPVGLPVATLLGAALFLCVMAILHQAFVPEALRMIFLRGPVHVAIVAVAAICLVLTLLPLAGRVSARILSLRGTLVGLLPLLGFFGTVAGLMEAVSALPMIFAGGSADPVLLRGLLDGLALAFETSLLGIGAAIALVTLAALVATDEAG